MKKYLLLLSAVVLCPSVALAEDPTFIQQINAFWKARNYNQILQLATTESQKQPVPPEAYAVLFGYKLYIAANRQEAVQALNQLETLLQASDPEGFEAVNEFKNEFLQVAGDQMEPPTAPELNGLHQMFPNDFPIKTLLFSISKQE
jgi:hypothetical protein